MTSTAQGAVRPAPPRPPHRIASEDEALQAAAALAHEWREGAAARDRDRRLPWDELERYTASGLGGITVPREYGGLGASLHTLAQVFVTLSAADASLGQIPQNHFAVIQNLRDHGTEAQKRRWFADVLAGHRLGNGGPERKARAAHLYTPTTHLARDARGRLRLSGTRYYSTGALFAHWIPLRAWDEQNRPVQVWVRRGAPGVTVIDDWDGFGQRTTASGSLVLEDVAVADEDVVALYAAQGRPTLSGPISQLIQASIDQGIAEESLAGALRFVREKTRPYSHSGVANAWEDPYVIQEAGQLRTEVDAAREVLLEAARTLDELAARPVTAQTSAQASVAVARAKILTTEAALNASERLLELAGTSAARAPHGLDRHWRNARVHTLHDPVRWKYHLLGNHLLNGRAPAQHQWN
ncbi:MAG: SfnB family sulfur acquisition oxidoreductase [Acidovorax sp.]